MAHTPLLGRLQKLFGEYRVAKANGLSLEALREQRERAPRVTRRELLGSAAAVGAAITGISRPVEARAGSQPRVAIVGGGIAGLTCALELADRGVAATVYEAAGRVGGRMFSNTSGYWADGQVSEWCGELIDTGHRTVRRLARRFNLPLDDLLAAEPAAAEEIYSFSGGHYPKAQAERDFEVVFDAVSADLDAAGYPTRFDDFTTSGRSLDQMSIYEWIETRVPGGHRSPLGALLDVAYVIEYGADSHEQSSLNLIYLLGFQPAPHHLAVFGESDERFHIRGGNQRLPEAMAASLGECVQLGHKLVRIRRTSGGRYALTLERGGRSFDEVVDIAVLCVPFAVLAGVDYAGAGFDARKDLAIRTLGRGHNGKINLQTTRRLWRGRGPWPGVSSGSTYSDTGYQASWDVSRAQPGSSGILVAYSGGSVTDTMRTGDAFKSAPGAGVTQDATRALSQIEPVYPGFTAAWNGKATQSLPHKSPFFKASYAFYRVGQYTSFGGHEGATQGGVLFAGEHTSQDFQGFMEGGASEGARAASEVLALVRGG